MTAPPGVAEAAGSARCPQRGGQPDVRKESPMRMRTRTPTLFMVLALLGCGAAAYAQGGAPPAAKIDTGDTAFVLISAALVMLMTPGLALFYGGMVRRKNALATIMQSFICLGLVGVAWVLYGYSLAFGPDKAGLIGGLEWLGLRNVGLDPNPESAPTMPHQAFMISPATCP